MSKKVLIIETSLRANSNSDGLAEAFAKGAGEAGNEVTVVSLKGKHIGFCNGCLACLKQGHCVIQDDAIDIAQRMLESDVLVFATPIYYYEMSGQMKTLLDRMNPLYGSQYKFRDIYALTTAAEDAADVPDRAVSGLGGWIDCFPKAQLAGSVFAGGVDAAGTVAGHKALDEAYAMGKTV